MKYDEFEKALKTKYLDCNFYIHKNDDEIEIIYSNRKYLNNDEFLDSVLEIARDYVSEKELWDIVTTYDSCQEIPKYQLELSKECVNIQNFVCDNDKYVNIIDEKENVLEITVKPVKSIPKRNAKTSILASIKEKILDITKEISLPMFIIDNIIDNTCESKYYFNNDNQIMLSRINKRG